MLHDTSNSMIYIDILFLAIFQFLLIRADNSPYSGCPMKRGLPIASFKGSR